jgi:XTP/dITP diphosphohydrolase
MPDAIRLILATRNRKKGEEMMRLLLPPWESDAVLGRLDAETLAVHPELPDPIEDAATFAGNARIKASAASRALGAWALADDSGLAVDALDGAPGVHSARYCGRHGDDAGNNTKLLAALDSVPDDRRGAAFVCALALADPTGQIRAEAEGACRGRILREIRGRGGFGYDPLFLIPEYHKSFGELPPLVKHQLSHRARAFEHMRPKLKRVITSPWRTYISGP